MYYIDIIILLIIILLIVILIYDVYRKDIKIIKNIELFNEFDYNKLGPIKFIDKDDPLHVLGYFPNGDEENGDLSAEQLKIIKNKGLSYTTIRIPRGTFGPPGEKGTQGPVGDEGPEGVKGNKFIGQNGKDGSPAPECQNGNPAPPCIPCSQGPAGNPAPPCGDAPIGDNGNPATPCIACLPGVRGEPADPCIQSPAPGSPGGAKHGNPASDCNCQCAECDPTKCENNVNLKRIDGENLVINTTNLDVNNNLNMKNNSKICFGTTCINEDTIYRINNI